MISEETLRALIVDDEVPAREHLTQLLECHCNVKIVGEANSVATAAALCRDLQPNLIFLDVQMPGGDGFSLLSKLDPLPAIIFVTGYDEYAVRAFEVNAVDYLIKPVNPHRLADALERIIHAPPQTQTKPFLPRIGSCCEPAKRRESCMFRTLAASRRKKTTPTYLSQTEVRCS